jgi:hypothetical protein
LVRDNPRIDWYGQVPKDFVLNLEYRSRLIEHARRDAGLARELWIACSRNILFWVNTFVWVYDALGTYGYPARPKHLPFITYPYQDAAFLDLCSAIGKEDRLIEKSRETCASYTCILVFLWFWQFHRDYSFLVVSRKETLVDKPNDPKSLFWKLDNVLRYQPTFLLPQGYGFCPPCRTKLHMHNPQLGGTIDGESTTGDVARGDRRAAILLDEFASFEIPDGYAALGATQSSTLCRIMNSTPKGTGNAFADMALPPSKTKKLTFHWTQMPLKAQGLYTSEDGKLRLLDREYWAKRGADDYTFILDGKRRSPWYDNECARSPVQTLIAQELDIDYLGSGTQFFNPAELQRIEKDYCRTPYLVGDLEFTAEGLPKQFVKNPDGRLRLWIYPDAKGDIPHDRPFSLGIDISMGTGASNSCISAGDVKTGEQVAEFVSPHIRPEDLAVYAFALGRWLGGGAEPEAFIVWDALGPGAAFGSKLRELGYHNFYYKKSEERIGAVPSDIPGFFANAASKRAVLSDYGAAMASGRYICRSLDCVRECAEFIFDKHGKIVHSKALSCMDPSGARENHGDRPTAGALCYKGMQEFPAPSRKPEEQVPETVRCYKWRQMLRDKRKREKGYVW